MMSTNLASVLFIATAALPLSTAFAFHSHVPPSISHLRRQSSNSLRRSQQQQQLYSSNSNSIIDTESTTTSTTLIDNDYDDDIVEALVLAAVRDERIEAPNSVVFYDNLPEGVVCARGVCVLEDFDDEPPEENDSLINKILNSYLGPRLLLAGASVLYGTNFPLGAMMNEALPPSAATCARMVLAAVALSPFLPKLDPKLAGTAVLCGTFTALGYATQSLALVDTSPSTVSFLGAAVVLVCPILEAVINKKPMGIKDAPQTWLAAVLCMVGVGILELFEGGTLGLEAVGFGDVLALLQAVGFGTSFFITERMMRGQPDQALPITAVQVSVSALVCMVWCFADGWIGQPGTEAYGLPGLFLNSDSGLQMAAGAVAWTGLITTAMNRFVETTALGKVSSAEASVILATEPLWAALFAALWLNQSFGLNDYVGGALIILACLANTLERESFGFLLENDGENDDDDAIIDV